MGGFGSSLAGPARVDVNGNSPPAPDGTGRHRAIDGKTAEVGAADARNKYGPNEAAMGREMRLQRSFISGSVLPEAMTRNRASPLPAFIPPQLTALVRTPPEGEGWLHEIKHDGYCTPASSATPCGAHPHGLNWTDKPPIAAALAKLPVDAAYLDGELCGVRPDGTTSFRSRRRATPATRPRSSLFPWVTRAVRSCRPDAPARDRARGR